MARTTSIAVLIALMAWSLPAAEGPPSLRDVYDLIYRLKFDRAASELDRWERGHDNDPRAPISRAAIILFQEFHRLDILETQFFVDDEEFEEREQPEPNPELKERFLHHLERAEDMAGKRIETNPEDVHALFAMTLARGLRANYLSLIEKRNMDALAAAKDASDWASKLLAVDPYYYDAYLAPAFKNYLVGDLFAPVRWLLSLSGYSGDKEKGIKQLEATAENGDILAPYARILLAIVYLREGDPKRAREVLAGLREQYPDNPLFGKEIARIDKKLSTE